MTSDLLTQSNTDCSCISVEKLTYHKWFTVSAAVAWIRRVAWHAQTPPPPPELMETAGIWRQTGANGQRKSKASQHIAFIVDDFITALLFFSFNSFVFCFYVLFFFSFVCLFVCLHPAFISSASRFPPRCCWCHQFGWIWISIFYRATEVKLKRSSREQHVTLRNWLDSKFTVVSASHWKLRDDLPELMSFLFVCRWCRSCPHGSK